MIADDGGTQRSRPAPRARRRPGVHRPQLVEVLEQEFRGLVQDHHQDRGLDRVEYAKGVMALDREGHERQRDTGRNQQRNQSTQPPLRVRVDREQQQGCETIGQLRSTAPRLHLQWRESHGIGEQFDAWQHAAWRQPEIPGAGVCGADEDDSSAEQSRVVAGDLRVQNQRCRYRLRICRRCSTTFPGQSRPDEQALRLAVVLVIRRHAVAALRGHGHRAIHALRQRLDHGRQPRRDGRKPLDARARAHVEPVLPVAHRAPGVGLEAGVRPGEPRVRLKHGVERACSHATHALR
jgi:hypothetical protein